MNIMRVLFSFAVAGSALAGAAEMKFVGLISDSKQTLFAIRVEPSAPVRWVAIGQSVGDYIVTSYDPKSESIVLWKGANRVDLRLISTSAADLLRQQCAGVAESLRVPVEDVVALVREVRDRHQKIVDAVLRTTDSSGIEVWLADDESRESGITVVFIRKNGRWSEDENQGVFWENTESKKPNKTSLPTLTVCPFSTMKFQFVTLSSIWVSAAGL